MNSSGEEEPGFGHTSVTKDASAGTIEKLLQRLTFPIDEIRSLTTSIRSDGWRRYYAIARWPGVVRYRAILRDPKDSMKLLPWTHRLVTMPRPSYPAVIVEFQTSNCRGIFPKYVIVSTVDFGPMSPFSGCSMPAPPPALSLGMN